MPRQRIKTRSSPVSLLGRLLLVLFCLAAIWYGLMILLLIAGIPLDTVDLISGYRTAYGFLAGLGGKALKPPASLIVAAAGILGFLLFGFLAYKELPRPYATRRRLALPGDERGDVAVEPRAIERVAESAAFQNPAVSAAAGRYQREDLAIDVHVNRSRDALDTLRDVQRRVAEALSQHELPSVPVTVTLTGFDQPQPHREIS
ncbi:MAG: hypothetical protein ACR2LA_03040 [Acidimicrobiales bacterium]